MKKTLSKFPWYMIYTPVVTAIIAMWYWNIQFGDGAMDYLEKVLSWLGLGERMIANIVIIALALIAFIFIFVKWFSTSKRLEAIEEVANTAPADITEHIDTANTNICNSIQNEKMALAENIATIKASTGMMAQQMNAIILNRSDVPVRQSQLISEITSLYAMHDRDQKIIVEQQERIAELDSEITKLKLQLQEAERELTELHRSSTREEFEWET